MIIVRNLTKALPDGQTILHRMSFQADEGELIAIVGASGSGKSSLLRSLMLKDKWTEGQYIYNGRDVTKLGIWDKFLLQRDWAYLEEKPRLNMKKSAVKNVIASRLHQQPIIRTLTGTTSTDEHVLAMDYLEQVGLLDKAHLAVEKMSGGERQRVALARGMVKGAKVIFADEPISGLAPDAARQVMEDLRNMCRKDKVTVICVLHGLEYAERYASRIWGLSQGRLVLDLPARRLTQREKDLIF